MDVFVFTYGNYVHTVRETAEEALADAETRSFGVPLKDWGDGLWIGGQPGLQVRVTKMSTTANWPPEDEED